VRARTGDSGALIASLGTALRGAFQWWLDELAGMVPDAVKRAFIGAPDLIALDVNDDAITVMRIAGGAWLGLGTLARTGPNGPAQLAALLGSSAPHADAVVVVLPADRAITRRLTLPFAVEAELERALGYEIERQTPFPAGQACFFHTIAWRDRRAGTLGVDVTVVPRDLVERATRAAAELGLVAAIATVPTGAEATALPSRRAALEAVNLLPRTGPGSSEFGVTRRRRVLALLFCAAIAGAALSPLVHDELAIAAGQRHLPAARARADQVIAVEQRAEAVEAEISAALAVAAAMPSPTRLLEALSAVLPDDTWLSFFRLGAGQLVIEGRTASAAALIRRLESVPGVAAVGFAAPVTRDARDGLEHFQFALTLTGAVP
jgi:general secretion pathway protein L